MATNNFTAQAVAKDLLRYVGVTGLTTVGTEQALNQPALDVDDLRRATAAINSALQTIQKHGPQSMKTGQRSALFQAPTAITLSVVHGLRAAVASSAPAAAVKGCSLLIDGDGNINRILATNGTAVTLLRAYLGTTGSVNGTVYYDCASLDADVQAVEEPVWGNPGNIGLVECSDPGRFERVRNRWWNWGWPSGYLGYVDSIASSIGTPALYLTERNRDGTVLLRVTPMPPADFEVSFQAKLRAERITSNEIGTGPAYTEPNYFFTSLHDDEVESILLPIARWRFFAHPALKNRETRELVKAEYDEVMKTLLSGMTLETSVSANHVKYI